MNGRGVRVEGGCRRAGTACRTAAVFHDCRVLYSVTEGQWCALQ